jgi:hypothetical protein
VRGRGAALAVVLASGLGPAQADPAVIATIDRLPRDVGASIARCWHPPHEGDEITLRMSFRRDGSVFGRPRITFMKAAGGADGAAELATSIYNAIEACSPLRFTPELGAAIAGRIFLIRFTAPRKEQRAARQTKWS